MNTLWLVGFFKKLISKLQIRYKKYKWYNINFWYDVINIKKDTNILDIKTNCNEEKGWINLIHWNNIIFGLNDN